MEDDEFYHCDTCGRFGAESEIWDVINECPECIDDLDLDDPYFSPSRANPPKQASPPFAP